MNKRFRVGLALLLLVLTSTTTLSNVGAATVRTQSRATTTIVWYNSSDPVRQQQYHVPMIAAFEKLHPDIQVKLEMVPNAQFDPKLSALYAAGTSPDVFSEWGQAGFGDYFHRGLLLDQAPYIKNDASGLQISDIPQSLINTFTVNGKIYGIPLFSVGSYLFYNADLFKAANVPEPPASWDDKKWNWATMVADAQKLTHDFGNPVKAQYGVDVNLWPRDAVCWLWGTWIFDPSSYKTAVPTTNNIGAPGCVAGWQAVADLTNKQKVQPSATLLSGMTALSDPMLSGRIAMMLTGGWEFHNLIPAKFNWNVAPLPWVKTNRDVRFSDPWFISSASKHPQAAWEFVKFLISPSSDKSLMNVLHYPPSHTALLPDWYKLFPNISTARLNTVVLGGLKYSSESPNHLVANYAQIDNTLAMDIQPILMGTTTAAQELPKAQADLNRILQSMK